MNNLITPQEALAIILGQVVPLDKETVDHAAALHRVLAQDITAQINLPPFDNSAMDGYAVMATDLSSASPQTPVGLHLLQTVAAGEVSTAKLTPGHCIKIMTGAPLPAAADAVIMREDTSERDGLVYMKNSPSQGRNIRRAGSDVALGQVVMTQGSLVRPAEWAMLASLGVARVPVYQQPRVAIIATGAELVDVDATLGPGQIRDSNSFALLGFARQLGVQVVGVFRVGDTQEELSRLLQELAPRCDAIISSGGVSAGDFDPVRDVLHQEATVHFWKIAMKPGKPVLFASYAGVPFFGLPGNPVSVMVAWEEFVRPALRRLGGHTALARPVVRMKIERNLKSPAGKVEFVRACVKLEPTEWVASVAADQGSGRLSTMVGANALLVIGADVTFVPAGALVEGHLIECPEQEVENVPSEDQ